MQNNCTTSLKWNIIKIHDVASIWSLFQPSHTKHSIRLITVSFLFFVLVRLEKSGISENIIHMCQDT